MPSPVRHSVPRDCFPREIKRLIAQSAAPSDIARLARSSSAWQDPAEEALWETVNIGGHKIGQVTTVSAGDESVGSFWRDCLDALDVRPARKRFVRRLRGPSTDRSVDVILTFLDHFRDQLVAIEQTPLPDGLLEDSDGAAFARAIDCARLMPHLTTLTIHLRHEWEAELAKALRSTPNLVNLALTVSGTDFASTSFRARPPLRLPKLRCLSVESIRWEQGVEMIQDGAPALSTLILGHNNSAFPVWRDGGPGTFTHLWTKRSLRELVICQRLLAENSQRATSLTQWAPRNPAPGLDKAVLNLPLKEGLMPTHPHISYLALTCIGAPTWDFCGTVPSLSTTGVIARWFVDVLEASPRLRQLDLLPSIEPTIAQWSDLPAPPTTMHIVTYTCDTDALYIVSYHSTWKSHPLDAHFRSYGRRQPSTFSQSECSEQGDPMNAGEFVFPDGYWSTPYCYPGLENLPDGPIIMAYYRGAPLPIALLNHVLTLAGPIVPAEGRGLDLPEEAWELLRAWFGELWSRPWHRTSHERVKTSTDLDIPDDGSSAEEDDDAYDLDSVMTSDDDSVRAMHKLHEAQAYMDDESDAYISEGNLREEDSEDSRDGENGEDGEDAVGMALNNHASSIATHGYPVPGHSGHDDDPANW